MARRVRASADVAGVPTMSSCPTRWDSESRASAATAGSGAARSGAVAVPDAVPDEVLAVADAVPFAVPVEVLAPPGTAGAARGGVVEPVAQPVRAAATSTSVAAWGPRAERPAEGMSRRYAVRRSPGPLWLGWRGEQRRGRRAGSRRAGAAPARPGAGRSARAARRGVGGGGPDHLRPAGRRRCRRGVGRRRRPAGAGRRALPR